MRHLTFLIVLGGSAMGTACSETPSSLTPTHGESPPLPGSSAAQTSWPTASGLSWGAGGLWIWADTRHPVELASFGSNGVVNFPAWSPDRSRVALAVSDWRADDPWQIQVLHEDGSRRRLSPPGIYEIAPSWSPDGKRLAVLSRELGHDEIYVMDADGTHRVRVTEQGEIGWVGFPAWSPDGKRIAYAWNGPTIPSAIWIVHPDGTDPVRLSPAEVPSAEGERPTWSPDGSRIAYLTNDLRGIVIITADGTGLRRLPLGVQATTLAWSPDGEFIAFYDWCHQDWDSECDRRFLELVSVADGTRHPAKEGGYAPAWIP